MSRDADPGAKDEMGVSFGWRGQGWLLVKITTEAQLFWGDSRTRPFPARLSWLLLFGSISALSYRSPTRS